MQIHEEVSISLSDSAKSVALLIPSPLPSPCNTCGSWEFSHFPLNLLSDHDGPISPLLSTESSCSRIANEIAMFSPSLNQANEDDISSLVLDLESNFSFPLAGSKPRKAAKLKKKLRGFFFSFKRVLTCCYKGKKQLNGEMTQ